MRILYTAIHKCVLRKLTTVTEIKKVWIRKKEEVLGGLKWSASLASNHRLSPLWVRVPQVTNAEDLSQYDPVCWTGHKTPTLKLLIWAERKEHIWHNNNVLIWQMTPLTSLHLASFHRNSFPVSSSAQVWYPKWLFGSPLAQWVYVPRW